MNRATTPSPGSQKSDSTGFSDFQPVIESALVSACEFGEGCPTLLSDAMRYALLAPGKRLRPALVLMAAEACEGVIEDSIPGAVAVEMIHAYSLIHDDLPAMDDDDLRRGRPTCHIQFDEATAILAGDGLIAEAFSQLAENVKPANLAAESIRILSKASGPNRLVGGQSDDLAAERGWADLPMESASSERDANLANLAYLESIHRRKTGALITASVELGAVLSGGSPEQRAALREYASYVGLAFQVVDDLLDLTADAETMGKRTGKDAEMGKLTYPGLLGLEGAKNRAEELI
ncbi:MAG: farnesyl diphosphate synthase, partial [Planctomycetota bacterium]|nr:farnesyl diphosphate synthase [Planctomycetota bacterium]